MKVSDYSKSLCCGCGVCAEVCPKNCINMIRDDEGFCYPVIDYGKCVSCGLCVDSCDFKNPHITSNLNTLVYGARIPDKNELNSVSSGGIGYILSSYVIKNGGIVYGVGFDDSFRVKHSKAINLNQLENFKLSKYVQSEVAGIYKQIISDLSQDTDRDILFIGTACQTAALKRLLNIKKVDTTRLYLCDVLCHGVPSPQIYEEFLEYAKKRCRSDVSDIRFRGKRYGWKNPTEDARIVFENGKEYSLKKYLNLFFEHYTLRPSCTVCPYTVVEKPSDITLADFWTADELLENFDTKEGVTMTVIHTQKGGQLFRSISGIIDYVEADERALQARQFIKPAEENPYRSRFWDIYKESGLEVAMRKNRKRYSIRVVLARIYHIILRKLTHEI